MPRGSRRRRPPRRGPDRRAAWLLAGFLGWALWPPVWAGEGRQDASGAVVSIIIDDLGYGRPEGLRALALPGPVAYSFLPHTPHAGELARIAFRLDKEVLLHLPMEAGSGKVLGPGGLTRGMSRIELDRSMRASIAAVPHATGMNNHMGSLLTRDPATMRWLMAWLRANSVMYFVDSRTTPRSVALRAAHEAGLRGVARDVFLDASTDPAKIRKSFVRLVAIARAKGSALAIAHPHPRTLEMLERVLPRPERFGVSLVSVAELIEMRGANGEPGLHEAAPRRARAALRPQGPAPTR